jgi:hypothetical protein
VKDLWCSDYVRTLDPPVIPPTDTKEGLDEDQNVGRGEHTDRLILDDWVYDGRPIDDALLYRDAEPPLKDMYAFHSYLSDFPVPILLPVFPV